VKTGSSFPSAAISFPPWAAAVLLAAFGSLLPGCYVLRQGGVLLSYQSRAVPLTEAAGPDAPEDLRLFAARVEDIRSFALRNLGLKENRNYTRFVELDRDYLAVVVSASRKDSFRRHQWRYPLVGTLPYKGFFDPRDARREADSLKARDLDVWVRRVDAFSTLGWFSDPLYSYMISYPPHRLAELLIHEQVHATVFLKNQAQFNEELAEFIGREGARLYIEKTYGRGSAEFRRMEDEEADSATFLAVLGDLIRKLEELYRKGGERETILSRKAEIIQRAQEDFAADYPRLFRSGDYRGFARLPVNNAYLELYRLYHDDSGYFDRLFRGIGGDLPRFIGAAKTLRGRRGDPKMLLAEALGLEPSP